MTTSPCPNSRSAWEVLRAVCLPDPGPRLAKAFTTVLTDGSGGVGNLIKLAVDRKVLPLLAAAIEPIATDLRVPRRIHRFLRQQLATSQYIALAYRQEAARIGNAAHQRGLPFALAKGAAVEQVLYGDTGARALSDIDMLVESHDVPAFVQVLTELGYRTRSDPHDRKPADTVTRTGAPPVRMSVACIRRYDDLIVPRFVVDLATGLPGDLGATSHWLAAALSRRIPIHPPNHPHSDVNRPVLSGPDQLTFTLATVSAGMHEDVHHMSALNLCADVLRLHQRGHRIDPELDPAVIGAMDRAIQWISQTFPAVGFPADVPVAADDRRYTKGPAGR